MWGKVKGNMMIASGGVIVGRDWRTQAAAVYVVMDVPVHQLNIFHVYVLHKLTGDKKLRVCPGLSGGVASDALEYSSVAGLHPAHRQPACCGDLVARVGQFGKRHSVLIPLRPGLGQAYTCACA